jgi:hypothetical protein
MNLFLLLLTLLISLQAQPASESLTIVRPKPAPGPLNNPMKGWCTYTNAGEIHLPYSMVFRYVSWKTLEPHEGDYRFAEWEKSWDEPPARGKHTVFRVYVDYPSLPSGIPAWLLQKGVKTTKYADYGGGLSPNYNHPAMVTGMERLIRAMGKRYNRDPRVAFIQIGLLGFWGEWHTYPKNQLFASAATQKRVIDAFRAAFPDKKLLARYPAGYAGKQPWLGFHDDMFPEDTDGSEAWKFLPTLRASRRQDNWKRAPIGGEMVPGQANRWMGPEFDHTLKMIERAHFSWIGPYSPTLQAPFTLSYIENCRLLVRSMGYEYCLQEIRHSRQVAAGGKLLFALSGINQGVAPFYYPWQVELALVRKNGVIVQRMKLNCDIRRWLPGRFQHQQILTVSVPPGEYTLALGIRDPMTGQPAIGFANALPYHNGWTVLSSILVTR